jgi:hypothetical protein
MTPPRDPNAPLENLPEGRQGTGTFMIREYTPIEPMPSQSPISSSSEKKFGSTGFIAALSVILGIILTSAVLIGGLGKAFFVTRDEYTKQEMVYSTQNSGLQGSLTRLEGAVSVQSNTLEKQDATLQRLIDKIQTIREDMARRGR